MEQLEGSKNNMILKICMQLEKGTCMDWHKHQANYRLKCWETTCIIQRELARGERQDSLPRWGGNWIATC